MRFENCCIDCSKRQGLRIFRLAQDLLGKSVTPGDETALAEKIKLLLEDVSPSISPAVLSYMAIQAAQAMAGCDDPFRKIKEENNSLALSLVPDMQKRIKEAADPLYMACLLSACGNIIDLGIQENFDIEKTIERAVFKGFAINHFNAFRHKLTTLSTTKNHVNILYICDNAGEIVFDRLFIKELLDQFTNLEIVVAVRRYPVLNDATSYDAAIAGIDAIAPVIDSGDCGLGITLSLAGEPFLSIYKSADLIISKGQANYETLSHEKDPIFFVLKAKCNVVATSFGVTLYDAIMAKSPYFSV